MSVLILLLLGMHFPPSSSFLLSLMFLFFAFLSVFGFMFFEVMADETQMGQPSPLLPISAKQDGARESECNIVVGIVR